MKRIHHSLGLALCAVTLLAASVAAQKGLTSEDLEKPLVRDTRTFLGGTSEAEPNNTCPGQAITCGDLIGPAAIGAAGDVDFYSFPAGEGVCLTILTERAPGQTTDTDLLLEILGADCSTVLASDDDSGLGVFPLIANWTAPSTGTYVLKVRHLSAVDTGSYQLSVGCHGAPDYRTVR